jgi:hypothetical protein
LGAGGTEAGAGEKTGTVSPASMRIFYTKRKNELKIN